MAIWLLEPDKLMEHIKFKVRKIFQFSDVTACLKKSYRCPKFDGDAKQTLEIRVEQKRNLKLGELGEVSFGTLKLGELGEMSFGINKLGGVGEVSFGMLKLGELGEL